MRNRTKCKNGNPKKSSRYICCRCLHENHVGDGIQRLGKQREKGHLKNLICLCTGLQTETMNVELSYCDNFTEAMIKARQIHNMYYRDYRKVG